jgi:glyoxylase-like metal-dependent hydrolase (beta-lactamase superfamily II)
MRLDRDVAEGIHRVEDAFTNWYLVEDGAELTVVDTGVPTSWSSLHQALGQLGRRADEIRAVVLTHAHFDHVGFAERARKELGVPVYVHENDVPLAHHPRRYSHEDYRLPYYLTQVQALPIVAALLRGRAFWPTPIEKVERYCDGTLPVPGSPQVVFTPGHTLGHCALHFPERDAVIAGDAIVMTDPYTAKTGPRIVVGAATADSQRNLDSLDALAATAAKTVLTGHGDPFTGGAEEAVARARAAANGKWSNTQKEMTVTDEQQEQDANPERQGPAGPSGAPDPNEGEPDQGPSGPPPEAIPGDEGEAPNPNG